MPMKDFAKQAIMQKMISGMYVRNTTVSSVYTA